MELSAIMLQLEVREKELMKYVDTHSLQQALLSFTAILLISSLAKFTGLY